MSGVDDGLGREWEDLFPDSIKENFATASGEVPATDAVGKKNIAAKKLAALRKEEAKAAWAVAWNMEELGFGPIGGERGGFVEKLGGRNGAKFFREAEGEHGVRLEAEKGGVGMIVDRAFGPLSEVGGVPDVVPVAVSEKESVGLELFLF